MTTHNRFRVVEMEREKKRKENSRTFNNMSCSSFYLRYVSQKKGYGGRFSSGIRFRLVLQECRPLKTVQAPAAAGARWEMVNFTNVFKVHISIKCKMKYSIKKFSRAVVPRHLNSSENILAWVDFIKKNNTINFSWGQ